MNVVLWMFSLIFCFPVTDNMSIPTILTTTERDSEVTDVHVAEANGAFTHQNTGHLIQTQQTVDELFTDLPLDDVTNSTIWNTTHDFAVNFNLTIVNATTDEVPPPVGQPAFVDEPTEYNHEGTCGQRTCNDGTCIDTGDQTYFCDCTANSWGGHCEHKVAGTADSEGKIVCSDSSQNKTEPSAYGDIVEENTQVIVVASILFSVFIVFFSLVLIIKIKKSNSKVEPHNPSRHDEIELS